MKYWKQGFYDEPIDGSVEITEEHYQELLAGQSAGLIIAESKQGYPILGMVWCSGWRLASAVSNAGGLGLIGAGSMHPDTLREHIHKCNAATKFPFGVNIPLMYPQIEEIMNIVVEEGVKIVFTSAGNPKTWTGWLKERGITVVHVVSSSRFAMKCEEAGQRIVC